MAVGATLPSLGERAALPQWLWAHLGLLLGITGYVLVWGGMRSESGRPRIHRWLMLSVPTGWFIVGIITQFPLVDALLATAYHLIAVYFLAASAIELWRDRLDYPLPSRLPLALRGRRHVKLALRERNHPQALTFPWWESLSSASTQTFKG